MTTTLETPQDDIISLTLAKFNPEELLNVILGLKHISDSDPERVKTMLRASQDLLYAILQAEFLMGLIDEKVLTEVSKTVNINASQSNVQETESVNKNESIESTTTGNAPAAPAGNTTKDTSTSTTTPPKKNLADLDPQQAEIIKQAIAIPDDQLSMLPQEQQELVRNLKLEYM